MQPLGTLLTVRKRLEQFSDALFDPPTCPEQILRARAWAGRRQAPLLPLRVHARPRPESPDPARRRDRNLERICERLLASLEQRHFIALRDQAPVLAGLLEALRVGPKRAAWIRELLGHANTEIRRHELDHAAEVFDDGRAAALGLLFAHALA